MDRWELLFIVSTLASVFIPMLFIGAIVLWGKQWRAAQDRAHARRIAEYKMNARLLRLDI